MNLVGPVLSRQVYHLVCEVAFRRRVPFRDPYLLTPSPEGRRVGGRVGADMRTGMLYVALRAYSSTGGVR
jgi:hypothetical protein